jgi:hypothetical protein
MTDRFFKAIAIKDEHFERVTSKSVLDMAIHENGGWRLLKEINLYVSYTRNGIWDSKHFNIPAGYWWDGASIPKLFRLLIGKPLAVEFCLPSLVHDFLYDRRYDRYLSDNVFFKLLEATRFKDIPKWKEYLMYGAVRLGGQAHYAVAANPKTITDKVGRAGWRLVKSIV